MIDHVAIQQEDSGSNVCLCSTCHSSIVLAKRPAESLANFRWVGPMPNELKDLTWIEELLIARAHVVGRVVRLQARNQASYFGIKGHPQDTTLLLDVLPMTPASLPDVVRVVWTGKSSPDRDRLRSQFTVRTDVMYNALQWLCRHNEDYQQVAIDHQQFARWPPVFVTTSSHTHAPISKLNVKRCCMVQYPTSRDRHGGRRHHIALRLTFACHFTRHAIHSETF